MGRHRSKNLTDPARFRRKGNAFYYDHGGQPRVWEPLGTDREEALTRYYEIENAKRSDGVTTTADLVDKFLAAMPRTLADGTRRNYRQLAALVKLRFGSCPVTRIRPGRVQEWVDLATAKMQARNAVVFMKMVYNKGVQWEYLPTNPLDRVVLPEQGRRTRYLEDDEFLKIRNALPEEGPYRLALELAYVLALRVSGVAGLKWAHIQGDRIVYQPPKSKKPLRVHVTDDLIDLFARCKVLPGQARSEYVICKRNGQPYQPTTISKAFTKAARRVGVDDTVFHDVRAKSASDDEPTAKERLLHVDARTTDIYLRRATVIEPIKPVKGK